MVIQIKYWYYWIDLLVDTQHVIRQLRIGDGEMTKQITENDKLRLKELILECFATSESEICTRHSVQEFVMQHNDSPMVHDRISHIIKVLENMIGTEIIAVDGVPSSKQRLKLATKSDEAKPG